MVHYRKFRERSFRRVCETAREEATARKEIHRAVFRHSVPVSEQHAQCVGSIGQHGRREWLVDEVTVIVHGSNIMSVDRIYSRTAIGGAGELRSGGICNVMPASFANPSRHGIHSVVSVGHDYILKT